MTITIISRPIKDEPNVPFGASMGCKWDTFYEGSTFFGVFLF